MWILTRDFISTDDPKGLPGSVCSRNFSDAQAHCLIHRFRLLDDDGIVHGEGVASSCDDDKAFDPLDDFGEGAWGCTAIEYWNEPLQRWEML